MPLLNIIMSDDAESIKAGSGNIAIPDRVLEYRATTQSHPLNILGFFPLRRNSRCKFC
jgi:hypothetical protein